MKVFLLALALVGIAFVFIGIKMFVLKGGQFEKKCTSEDPTSDKPKDCICDDYEGDETKCEFYEKHHGTQAGTIPVE